MLSVPDGARWQAGFASSATVLVLTRTAPLCRQAAPLPMALDVAPFQVYRGDHYPDRLQILRLLEAAYPVPPGLAQPMDGIVLQTAWQANSGRARYPWWSRANSSLNLWQLLALQSRSANLPMWNSLHRLRSRCPT